MYPGRNNTCEFVFSTVYRSGIVKVLQLIPLPALGQSKKKKKKKKTAESPRSGLSTYLLGVRPFAAVEWPGFIARQAASVVSSDATGLL
jgi:hypothetical protein